MQSRSEEPAPGTPTTAWPEPEGAESVRLKVEAGMTEIGRCGDKTLETRG